MGREQPYVVVIRSDEAEVEPVLVQVSLCRALEVEWYRMVTNGIVAKRVGEKASGYSYGLIREETVKVLYDVASGEQIVDSPEADDRRWGGKEA